jgi:hypothetical protein
MSGRLMQMMNNKLAIDGLEVVMDELLLSDLEPVAEFAGIQKIFMLGGSLRYPQRGMHIDKLVVDNPRIIAWLDEDGTTRR